MAKAAKTPHTSRKYFTVSEVAAILSVAPKTVYKWIAAGSLVTTRLPGNTLRINETYLNSWLDKRTIEKRGKSPRVAVTKQEAESKLTYTGEDAEAFAERLVAKWNKRDEARAIAKYTKLNGKSPPADLF